jgi:hypothetical protein
MIGRRRAPVKSRCRCQVGEGPMYFRVYNKALYAYWNLILCELSDLS